MAIVVLNVTAQNALIVYPADGSSSKSILLDNIQKLTFSGDNLLLKTDDSSENTYSLATVRKITFEDFSGIIPVLPVQPEIILYPNPVSDYIRIDSSVDITSWTLYDLNGKILKQSVFKLQIPVIDLPAGFYFLKLTSANGSVTKKFIKR
jgi:hypothetical protein